MGGSARRRRSGIAIDLVDADRSDGNARGIASVFRRDDTTGGDTMNRRSPARPSVSVRSSTTCTGAASRRGSGFTLIELLVVITMLTIFMSAAIALLALLL